MGNKHNHQIARLAELGHWVGGGTPSTDNAVYWNGTIPWVSPKDMWTAYITFTQDYITEAALSGSATTLVPKDSILVVTRSGILRSRVPVALTDRPMAINQDIKALISNGTAHTPYIAQYLWGNQRKLLMQCVKVGTTVESIDLQQLKDFAIFLPSLSEQKKIAAILRTWDEAIEKYQSYLSTANKKRQLIIQKAFAPERWPLATMADVAEIIVSNVDKKSVAGQQSVRLCNYMDVFYNRYITGDINFMEATASEREIATYALKKGDAVFTKDSETPEEIAMCASVEENIPGLLCGYHLAIARPKTGKILGAFLAEAINSPHVHHQFYRSANGATRFGLTRGDIDGVELPLPPIKEQEKIIAVIRHCDREKELTEKKIKNLQQQKRGLMQKLLTGAWRVKSSQEAA